MLGTYPTGMFSPATARLKAGLAALVAVRQRRQALPPAELRSPLGYSD
jgi:hypothetical protein